MAWHKRFQPEKPVELPDKLDDCGPDCEVVVLSPLPAAASEDEMEFCC